MTMFTFLLQAEQELQDAATHTDETSRKKFDLLINTEKTKKMVNKKSKRHK